MKKLVLALALTTASIHPAAAATLVQSGTLVGALPGTRSILIGQFDSALGTLNSVDLIFSANSISAGTILNTTALRRNYTLSRNVTAGIVGNGFGTSATLLSGSTSFSIPRFSAEGFSYTGSGAGFQTLVSGLSPFIGTGTTTLDFTTTSAFSKGATPGTLLAGSLIGGNYSLTYNFTAVPEPATWAMMIAGFAMIGFGMRNRRKQSMRVTYA